jgi:hypothetical protein
MDRKSGGENALIEDSKCSQSDEFITRIRSGRDIVAAALNK